MVELEDARDPDSSDVSFPSDELARSRQGNIDTKLRIGLDIGGTKTLGVVTDHTGLIVAEHRRATQHGPNGVVDTAVETIRNLVAQVGAADTISGIGVGIPGLVHPTTGTVSHAVNLEISHRFALRSDLHGRLETVGYHSWDSGAITIDNDVNLAALGTAYLRDDLGGDLAFLSIGTGLAAAVMLDGRLRRGAVGAAGEIGHIPMEPAGAQCPCGQRGCLELYASGSALENHWGLRSVRPVPRVVFEAASRGEVRANRIKDEFTNALGWAVRLLVVTYDVSHVVLGGGVSSLGQPLLDAVREQCDRACQRSAFLRALNIADRVVLAPMDIPVAAVGAALVRAEDFGRSTQT